MNEAKQAEGRKQLLRRKAPEVQGLTHLVHVTATRLRFGLTLKGSVQAAVQDGMVSWLM